jgi:hypothetical protein
VEPPGISVLTVGKSSGNVIAAHHNVVLLAITIPFHSFVDLFVYQASRDDPSRRRRPYLLLLPSAGGPRIQSRDIMCPQEIGIMSCTSNDAGEGQRPRVPVWVRPVGGLRQLARPWRQ